MSQEPTEPPIVEPAPDNPPEYTGNSRFLLVMAILCAPAIGAAFGMRTHQEGFAISATFLGSAMAAVGCGILIAANKPRPVSERVVLALALTVGLFFVSIALCLCGCALGSH
jgi:hypothetical protein